MPGIRGGGGVNADVDVWQDATGKAWPLVRSRREPAAGAGAFHIFKTETDLDLFSEQALWPAIFDSLLTAYEVLVDKVIRGRLLALELYPRRGGCRHFSGHGETRHLRAVGGVFTRLPRSTGCCRIARTQPAPAASFVSECSRRSTKIQGNDFASEWTKEQASGYPAFVENDVLSLRPRRCGSVGAASGCQWRRRSVLVDSELA